MADWQYLIPRYFDSPWHRRDHGSVFSTDLNLPNVGVYCPHEPTPWLLGSFQVSSAVLEQKGEVLWAWTADYVTGDGHVIHLKRQSPEKHTQYLVDDKLHNRAAEADALRRAIDKHGIGPETTAIMERMNYADANMRGRCVLECEICGLRKVLRSENVQMPAGALWELGRREVTLESFIKFEATLRRVASRA